MCDQSMGREDHLEKGIETHSSMLAWRILWTEEAGGPQSIGSQIPTGFKWISMHAHIHIERTSLVAQW